MYMLFPWFSVYLNISPCDYTQSTYTGIKAKQTTGIYYKKTYFFRTAGKAQQKQLQAHVLVGLDR